MTATPDAGDANRSRWWLPAAQVAGSALVIALLLREADTEAVLGFLRQSSPGWLALALVVKALALVLHEVRLWLAFNPPRPPPRRTVAIGLAAGLLNTVLPMRAGDVIAIAMLKRECRVSVGKATAAIGVSSFLEAALFGCLLLGVLVAGAGRFDELIDAASHREALQWVTVATLGGVALATGAVILGRRLRPEPEPDRPSPLALLRETLRQTSGSLGAPARLGMHVGLAAVDVLATVGAFALLLPAVGLDVPLPFLAASGVLAVSALASIVLPPTYGAGPAAASVAVLAAFGVDAAGALAFAAGYWVVSQAPAAVLGLPCLIGRRPSGAGPQ